LTRPIKGPGTGFDDHCTAWNVANDTEELFAPNSPFVNRAASPVDPMQLKDILRQIDALKWTPSAGPLVPGC
jgi:hypothetical protein